MARPAIQLAWVLGIAALLAGCSSNSPQGECRLPDDCPDGYTCAGGECQELLPDPDTGVIDAEPDAGGEEDLARPDQQPPPDASGDDAEPICQGNNNGKIEREELVFDIPSEVDYTVGSGVAVDLEGTVWDLTASADDDHTEKMKLETVPAWAAGDFPDADYASLMNKDLGTHGIFKVTPTKMQLLGAISADEDYGRVTYGDPVDLLRFPIVAGDSYSTSTYGTGFWGMAMINNYEAYEVDVVAEGVVELPMLSLDAVLVRTKVTQYVYFNPFLQQTYVIYLLVAECYGTVARIVVDGDPGDGLKLDASMVQERWRLASP